MANELRIRQVGIGGLVEDNPLTSGATQLTSAGLQTVAGGVDANHHMAITIDPDSDLFEIAYVTSLTPGAGATGSSGLLRGQEGTTARQFEQGTPWVHSDTAADLNDRTREPAQRKLYLPNAFNDEFDDDTLAGAWTRVDRSGNTGGATWQEKGDCLSAILPGSTDNASEMHALLKPMTGLTTAPVTIEVATRFVNPYALNYNMFGPVFADGTTYGSGKQMWLMPFTNNSLGASVNSSLRSYTNFSGQVSADDHNLQFMGMVMYHRLIWSATNTFQQWVSPDGWNWIQVGSNMSYTMTPTYFGFGVSTWGSSTWGIVSFEYFRVS